MLKIHLDTDIGGDVDDICALAYLLRLDDVELVGLTTSAEEDGRRAGYARHVLDLAGFPDVPVKAGANVADHNCRYDKLGYPDELENWGMKIPPRPNPLDDALDLLKASIDEGARIVVIGPLTNLRLLDERYPGILQDADIYLMGGYIYEIPTGYPQWGNSDDWNLQLDVTSAKHVFIHCTPTIIPMTVTVQTFITRAHLTCLEQEDTLAHLLARQLRYFPSAEDNDMTADFGLSYDKLPDDFINFQHDPLACAVAVGYRDGIHIDTLKLSFDVEAGYLHEHITDDGKPIDVVTHVDGATFAKHWLDTVCLSLS